MSFLHQSPGGLDVLRLPQLHGDEPQLRSAVRDLSDQVPQLSGEHEHVDVQPGLVDRDLPGPGGPPPVLQPRALLPQSDLPDGLLGRGGVSHLADQEGRQGQGQSHPAVATGGGVRRGDGDEGVGDHRGAGEEGGGGEVCGGLCIRPDFPSASSHLILKSMTD